MVAKKPEPANLVPVATHATRVDDSRASSPDGAFVVVVSGAARGTSVKLPGGVGAALRIGTAPDNDIVLPDDTVSRHHVAIRRVPGGILVEDLNSTNG
ncbi:MAG: FHA domain-containing protein, partial [Polyangiales bacterium]